MSSLRTSLMVTAQAAGKRLYRHRTRSASVTLSDREDRRPTSISRPATSASAMPRAKSCSPKAAHPRSRRRTPKACPSCRSRQQFNRGTDEGFYGLGQHQNRQMNYNGEDVELAQHNMDVAIPFVVSTRNYGLLWDNNSITRFGDPEPYPMPGARRRADRSMAAAAGPRPTAPMARPSRARQEPAINLQYLENRKDWPAGTRTADGGSNVPGLHGHLDRDDHPANRRPAPLPPLFGSSYAKVFVDGREVLNRWRQNWNPWYHNFDLELAAGQPHEIRVEWEPNGGYIALLHNDPRPERRPPFADAVVRVRAAASIITSSAAATWTR